ncbi:uncharacterized protein LY89DRAFT_399972 [Mollisia scopiformis]|uniref:Uncharacterized protein n=1 Tax=Mollisia scopiformis TaxID=149040 RepID=A0A132B4F3_MOLSC|nr:uncharacterized protein LY89DRAFT_399972 [Mollisia scopiformis]KUJ06889.1 hypothetical protein LY89DRAFT_399972 [Mollisia scopiformis]
MVLLGLRLRIHAVDPRYTPTLSSMFLHLTARSQYPRPCMSCMLATIGYCVYATLFQIIFSLRYFIGLNAMMTMCRLQEL